MLKNGLCPGSRETVTLGSEGGKPNTSDVFFPPSCYFCLFYKKNIAASLSTTEKKLRP